MTPKEKAEELINKYFNAVLLRNTSRKLAKKLALIAVDEVINSRPSNDIDIDIDISVFDSAGYIQLKFVAEYWEKVKTEINNN